MTRLEEIKRALIEAEENVTRQSATLSMINSSIAAIAPACDDGHGPTEALDEFSALNRDARQAAKDLQREIRRIADMLATPGLKPEDTMELYYIVKGAE